MSLDTSDLKQIGEFTPITNRRHLIRSAKNPMDKCTIVSIYPKDIFEEKWTIEPGKFTIPAGSFQNPSIFTVGPSSWWREIDVDQPMLEIPVSSIQIADSIIKDYCNGMLGCDMSSAMPGLFFVLGEVNKMEITLRFKSKLEEINVRQNNWFNILIRIADSLWARSNGNPLVIWDIMRLAARSLNYEDKPWLKDFQMAEMIKCKACGGLRNPEFPVCPACKSIDPSHPLAKELKFAV